METSLLLLSSANFAKLDLSVQQNIYREYYRMVYPQILYIVKDHGATEDIIQETFLQIVKKFPRFENISQIRGWIRVVARNASYNYIRKFHKNKNLVAMDHVFINENVNYATDAETVETEVELKAVSEAVSRYLLDLRPDYRILVELRWKQGLSYKEMAEVLDIEEEVVKTKLHRARDAIKKRFLKEWRDSR
jgi:RNA polymerase sigma-70 factor (ECF subfamily)